MDPSEDLLLVAEIVFEPKLSKFLKISQNLSKFLKISQKFSKVLK